MDVDVILTPPQQVLIKNEVIENIRLFFPGLDNMTLKFIEFIDTTAEARFENIEYLINIFRNT